MNYVKSCLIITMLLGVGYSECNESNWQEYYPNMAGCFLIEADLYQANLSGAYCYGAFFVAANLEYTQLDGADLTYAYFDENVDQYDDVSYNIGFNQGFANGYDDCAESGDLNQDGGADVLDVITLVNIILNP